MTGPELVANLQEEPAGRPWQREWVRDWLPAPFDPVKYEEFAKEEAGLPDRTEFDLGGTAELWRAMTGDPLL